MNFLSSTTICISGCTRSGKTTWLRRLLEEKWFDIPPKGIMYCYGVWQDVFDSMKDIEFHEGLPSTKGQNQMGIILAPLKEYLVGFNPSVLIKTIKQLHGKDEPGDDPTLVENRKKVDEARSVKGVFDIAKSMIVK